MKKFSPTNYPLVRAHRLRMDEQTDDNHDNSSTVT